MSAPGAAHDTPAGDNPEVRNMSVEVLSDQWYTLRLARFDRLHRDGMWRSERREAYDRGNGVVAMLHDPVQDTVILVRQYRAPVHLNDHPDGMLLEAPAGLLDAGEDADEAIRREVEEEVGHRIEGLTRLWRLYMSPGSVTEHVTFYVGRYSSATRRHDGGGLDSEGENIDVFELALDKALAMVDDGRIVDAKTVLLLMHLRLDRQASKH
jgi:nudix-type nucleoside diphosphatase (YffH/AdpP family)